MRLTYTETLTSTWRSSGLVRKDRGIKKKMRLQAEGPLYDV